MASEVAHVAAAGVYQRASRLHKLIVGKLTCTVRAVMTCTGLKLLQEVIKDGAGLRQGHTVHREGDGVSLGSCAGLSADAMPHNAVHGQRLACAARGRQGGCRRLGKHLLLSSCGVENIYASRPEEFFGGELHCSKTLVTDKISAVSNSSL